MAAIEAQHFLQSRQDAAPAASAVLGTQDLNPAWVQRVRGELQQDARDGEQVRVGCCAGVERRRQPAVQCLSLQATFESAQLLAALRAGCARLPCAASHRMKAGGSWEGLLLLRWADFLLVCTLLWLHKVA